jgi:translation initiation factor 3 subunit H
VTEVHIDGLALLKLVKHCRDSLPRMVAGSLLGLDQGSILEVTHCFPFPAPSDRDEYVEPSDLGNGNEDIDGEEYQMEMMKMLREVNVDNNCVGWYKSIYLGSFCQTPLVETQFSYQENLSDNCVVLLYDPIETGSETLNVKAYQLSQQFITSYRAKLNAFVAPSSILVELPLKIRNPGLITAFLYDLRASGALKRELGTVASNVNKAAPLERYLEHCCQWVDDLVEEQGKFQYYLRNIERHKDQMRWHNKRKCEGDHEDADAPSWKNTVQPLRLDSLLIANQIKQYCSQITVHSTCALSKIHLSGILQEVE